MSALRGQYFAWVATLTLLSSGCAYNGGVQEQLANIRDALRPIGETMNSKLYVVQTGDNLSYIAWRYQTTVQNLIVWNNLSDPDVLQTGQRIVVRGNAVAPVMTARAEPNVEAANKVQVRPYGAGGQLVAQPLRSEVQQQEPVINSQSVIIPPSDEQTIVVLQPQIPAVAAVSPVAIAPVEEPVVVNKVSYKKSADGQWVWPVGGSIMKPFGGAHSNQKGIDISSTPGEPIRATTGGIVAFAGSGVSVLGNTVIIDHDGDMVSAYTQVGELLVEEGVEVMAGDVIAFAAAATGDSKSRVHFEIRKQGRPLDPLSRLAKR